MLCRCFPANKHAEVLKNEIKAYKKAIQRDLTENE